MYVMNHILRLFRELCRAVSVRSLRKITTALMLIRAVVLLLAALLLLRGAILGAADDVPLGVITRFLVQDDAAFDPRQQVLD